MKDQESYWLLFRREAGVPWGYVLLVELTEEAKKKALSLVTWQLPKGTPVETHTFVGTKQEVRDAVQRRNDESNKNREMNAGVYRFVFIKLAGGLQGWIMYKKQDKGWKIQQARKEANTISPPTQPIGFDLLKELVK